MVSRNETYGLVYLEAMLHGCIVIASKDEGIDGIIVDGVNGFLCEAGNIKQLIKKLEYIDTLDVMEKQEISRRAIQTALSHTDSQVARMYLNHILM